MEKIIAKKSIITLFLVLISSIFVIYICVDFFISYEKKADSLFPLDFIVHIGILVYVLYVNYKIISKPRILILKRDSSIIIYPNSPYEEIIPISDIVSISNKLPDSFKSTTVVTINTKSKGYQIIGVRKYKNVIEELNTIIKDKKEKAF